jgi:valyl-tRNA synthetase
MPQLRVTKFGTPRASCSLNLDIEPASCQATPRLRQVDYSRLNNTVREVTENLDKFDLGIALSKLFDFIWTSSATGISS